MTVFPLVVVQWADAHSPIDGWTYISDLEDDGERIILTSGFELPEDNGGKKGHLTIVQSLDGDSVDHAIHIPLAMVRSRVVVPYQIS